MVEMLANITQVINNSPHVGSLVGGHRKPGENGKIASRPSAKAARPLSAGPGPTGPPKTRGTKAPAARLHLSALSRLLTFVFKD